MQGPMMDGNMMMLCMVASTLFGLIVAVAVIIQAVLQARILRELRELKQRQT